MKADAELQLITEAFKKQQPDNRYLDLARPLVDCLRTHYADQIGDPSTMATILRTNKAYANHFLTYKKVEGGLIPDVSHKFFTTDLPFGLCIYKVHGGAKGRVGEQRERGREREREREGGGETWPY